MKETIMSKFEQLRPAPCFLWLGRMNAKKRQSKLIVMVTEPISEVKLDEKKEEKKEMKFGHINDWKHIRINKLRKLK